MSLRWNEPIELPGGGALRTSGPADARDRVVLVPGATSVTATPAWSSNLNWLAPRLRRAFGSELQITQLRFGTPSWQQIELPIADVRRVLEQAAIGAPADQRTVLVGFSMGGAASLANADAEGVVGLVGIAPWLPKELSITALAGRKLRVVHGSLDGELPGIPGVKPASSQAAVARAHAVGIDATFTKLTGGLHGIALPLGRRLVPMPRAGAFTRFVIRSVRELLHS